MSATHRRIHGRQLAMCGPCVRRALARGTVSVVGDDWEALARRMRLLGVPVTLRFADAVGEILTAAPRKNELPPLPFRYYI